MSNTKKAPQRACEHPKGERKTLNGGLQRCTKCGAIRGVDGIWRTIR